MTLPRLRLSWLMVGVVLVAINLAVMRAAFNSGKTEFVIALGGMPMATVLGIALAIGWRWPETRLFHLGFVSCGILALAIYVLACLLGVIGLCAELIFITVNDALKYPVVALPVAYFVVVVALLLPQVIFALLGGWRSKSYEIDDTRRQKA